MNEEKELKILREARERLKKCEEEDGDNRKKALEDLQFMAIEGAQWPDQIKNERLSDGRPCLEINKMPVFVDQVVGDQRQNRPSIKVLPVDSKADPKVASILGGWVKHVHAVSKADIAIDHGFEHAVACGYGAMRVVAEYSGDDTFEQDARIRKVENALAVWWGPHTEYDCSDAKYCFLVADVPRDEFKDKYKTEPAPFDSANSMYVEGWATRDTVRVAEYFVKEPKDKTIYLLSDGRVVEKLEEGDQVVKDRKVKSFIIKRYLLSANKILEENEWVGRKYIPIIPIWGKELNVGGKRVIRGLIRHAKDPQRMYNYWESCDTELVALAPKAPYLATPEQLSGHEGMWKEAHKKNYPYLLFNPDNKYPGPPQRQVPPQASSAMTQKIAQADQEIRDTMGLQKAALGMQSNERSGAAIRERKQEGDTGTFAFVDNLARSIEHLGRVLIDMAPRILDTERIIRLGLEDGVSFEGINVDFEGNKLNDISVGTYDIVCKVGPSFSTQRTEARLALSELIQYYPAAAPLISDLYVKYMDTPGADELAERLKFLLPPEIRAKVEKEEAEKSTGQVQPPPDQTIAAQPPPPDPLMILKVKQEEAKLAEQQLKVEQEKAKLEGMLLENQLKVTKAKGDVAALVDEILKEGEGNASKEQETT